MATNMNPPNKIKSVWNSLLALEEAAQRCATRSRTEPVTERTAEVASAALQYAAAHLESVNPGNDAARMLVRWSRDVIAGTRDDQLGQYQAIAITYGTRFVSRMPGSWEAGAGTYHPLKLRTANMLADELRQIGVDASVVPHATDHEHGFVIIAARSLPIWGS